MKLIRWQLLLLHVQFLTIITSLVGVPQCCVQAFSSSGIRTHTRLPSSASPSVRLARTSLDATLQDSVTELKRVLEREYVSFFNPMRTEYYAPDVTFDDPLTALVGIDAYKTNVDMLAGRTLLGSILFEDGGINLHSITGGDVVLNDDNGSTSTITDIITRWTLRFTMKVFFWKPTARFSGISIYKIKPKANLPASSASGTSNGSSSSDPQVQIVAQMDYWDSINLMPGGSYEAVGRGDALNDFINQLKPGGFQASSAAPELPFALLRRAKDYEVRRYPPYYAVQIQYQRRDEGFGTLGAFTAGTEPAQGPAIMNVDGPDTKYMQWPLTYAAPGSDGAPEPQLAILKSQDSQWSSCNIIAVPSKVVAIAEFSDASLEPVVRKADRQLRASLQRDGLGVRDTNDDHDDDDDDATTSMLTFAQYDAIFSMGKRRGEVWIDLKDGTHPW